MTDTTSRFRTVRYELTPRLATVVAVEDLSPTYRRITLNGEHLATFQSLSPEDHIKVALPEPGANSPTFLEIGPNGPFYPEGVKRPTMRDYTPREFNPATNELTVDFVIHGDGPASNWAAQAVAGQQVGILGPRGSHIVEDVFDSYVLIGDETMLPSIARRLEEASPESTWVAFIEVDSAADEQVIQTAANAKITWVHRNGAPAGTTSVLEDAVRAWVADGVPEGEVFVWAGGEAATLRGIRRFMLNDAGFNREWVSFSGHWKYGVADHDHHEAIED